MRHFVTVFVILTLACIASEPCATLGQMSTDGAAPAAKAASPSASHVQQWIRELDDDRYAVREAATTELSHAGREAIAPLAKAAAAGGVEVTSRCVRILTLLAVADDPAVAEAAREALETLISPDPNLATDRAAAALENVYVLEAERAREKLLKRGATHGSRRNFHDDTTYPNHLVLLKKSWTGGIDDLKLLKYLQDVDYLSIYGVKLGDAAIPHLSRLRHVRKLELYGTGLTAEQVKKLKTALPQLTTEGDNKSLDVRGGGLLGVSGQYGTPNCQFTDVRPNSGAAKAGLLPGDIATAVDGKPIDSFRKFLDYVSTKSGGDKIKLDIQRGEEKVQVEVTLGHWGDE